MNWLTKFSLKNTVAVLILTVLVLAMGIIATEKIKVETFPDVTFPVMTVQTVYPNASTEEVEENVTKPLEDALLNLEDYDSISSTSQENVSIITIMYPFGQDTDEAQSDINNAISGIETPDGAETEVTTLSINSTPIYQGALSSEDLDMLQQDVDSNIVPDLQNLDGVSTVNVTGTSEERIQINVDEEEATSYGLSLSTISDAIQRAEYKLPAGSLEKEGASTPVEIKGDLDDLDALKSITIPTTNTASMQQQAPEGSPEGAPQGATDGSGAQPQATQPTEVTLDEIAEISQVTERSEISRFNGEDSILIEVTKAQDANTAEVADEVKAYLADVVDEKDYELYTVLDQGEEVNKSISALLKEGGFGALFTVIVILLFLRNIRATLIAIISLPISILGSIALLEQFDYTLNIMTLGGMAVAVGRIVDDSIVVIENIYRWKQQYPDMKQREVVFKATKEVMGAVASSTIATLIVFLPLAFVSGILGEFFRPFSLAVVFSIVISLIVAIMLIPVLGKFFFKNVKHHEESKRFTNWYEKFLRGSLKKKWVVFTLSFVLLFGSFSFVPALGVSFLPSEGSEAFEIEMTLPNDTTLEQTSELAQTIEEDISGDDQIDYSQVSIGFSSQQQMPGMTAETSQNIARFFIQLNEDVTIDTVLPDYEERFLEKAQEDYPEATVKATEVQQEGPPAGNSIDVNLYSEDVDDLREASAQVGQLLEQDDQLKNIQNDMEDTKVKYEVSLNEEGKDLGVSPFQLMEPIRERLQPLDGGTLTLQEEWDIQVTFDEQLSTKEELESFTVQTREGEKELRDIASIEEVQVPTAIKHQDGETASTVSATIIGDDTAAVSSVVQEDVEALSLPDSVEVEFAGGLEMITEGFADLGVAMAAAVGLVFLVLSITFGGVITPIVILSSLIFIPIGSLAGLFVTGQTLSMSAMIGMLMLIGIVVTNAVVLLDRVEANRRDGKELTEAIVEASRTRLRPILMTALATIFALVPLALSNSASGLISKGLAITVIGGLTTSTLLTLVFVPVFYHAIGKRRKIEKD
ncbi:acriflavin resistance protein [Pontibacillus halophilus JSM 076056 = DSM 19796]|uniref:Acriflavin resistance protein n=1 Tax=Pontibacillus halophilus JSM 076056 = DSM 19796 TaxID=1385510 RepID=A0A0A5GH66_9BACI|nr:efflux RND transporter permease subunit [Pontibacillus halophilus]KGX91374.1 acriflavin resistance protein [Pontibacillus halophilus JSM 076056 = DSM 19796]